MSKERLEEIKRQFNINKSRLIRLGRNTHVTDDYEWLIEQAERAQELEDVIYQDARQGVIEELYEENERYREALEEIKRLWERSTDATCDTNLAWKMSCEAHEALEESK